MQINTKFNSGDKVWVMKNNKPHEFEVNRVEITLFKPCSKRELYFEVIRGLSSMDKDREFEYPDYDCFASKKELLDSFMKNEEVCKSNN